MEIAQSTGKNFADAAMPGRLRLALAEIHGEIAAQKSQLFLWFPVFLSFGIGAYYALRVEPPFILAVFALAVSAAALAFSEVRFRTGVLLLFLITLGFFAAQARTHIVHTPILQKEISVAMVTGTIDAVEDLGEKDGSRIILKNLAVEDLLPERTPVKVRLKVRKDHGLSVGQRVSVMANLNPPSPPVMPGAFDFQRHLYFQQIGAVGFVYKQAFGPLQNKVAVNFIEQQRQQIAAIVEKYMPYPEASIAIALLNGRMTAISEEDSEAFRDSGLAHLLSISGLHVGLFCGVLFFVSRLLMALIPGFALHHPIKKYAAVIAMIGAFYYMLLAGSPIPTQRSVLMSTIVFLAIIIDRSPISLRLVAFAAFAVLLIFPESLLSVSFQMSFAAVAWLIWCFEKLAPRMAAWRRRAGFMKQAALYFLSVCATTLIASVATAPFGLFHFQQFALFGTVANLIAVPLMAFIIMPGVVGALMLMPLGSGLVVLPLWIMQKGIDATLEIAHWAASLPHATITVEAWPFAALLCFVMAMIIAALWRGSLRSGAFVFLALSFAFISMHRLPDILVSQDFDVVAYRDEGGMLHVSTARKAAFIRENWARAYGFDPDAKLPVWPREGREGDIVCDGAGCRIGLKKFVIAYTDDPLSLRQDCAEANIVLAAVPAQGCRAPVVIDLLDSKFRAGHAVWLDQSGPVVESVEASRGARPWSSLNNVY